MRKNGACYFFCCEKVILSTHNCPFGAQSKNITVVPEGIFMKDKQALLWERFTQTGKVADYLAYTQGVRDMRTEGTGGAAEDERHHFLSLIHICIFSGCSAKAGLSMPWKRRELRKAIQFRSSISNSTL